MSQLTILFSPNPASYYPAISKKLEEEGQVQLRIYIDEKGLVESTEVVRSSQSTRLDAAAARLARDTRFKPYAPEGVPIRISALLTVSFRLTH
jgi:protein TonB